MSVYEFTTSRAAYYLYRSRASWTTALEVCRWVQGTGRGDRGVQGHRFCGDEGARAEMSGLEARGRGARQRKGAALVPERGRARTGQRSTNTCEGCASRGTALATLRNVNR